jgi:hypothetical protein
MAGRQVKDLPATAGRRDTELGKVCKLLKGKDEESGDLRTTNEEPARELKQYFRNVYGRGSDTRPFS